MSNCNHDCSSCQEKCDKESLLKKPHKNSSIKKVIAVVSGKGGVGKSLVTSLMAVTMQRKNHNVAILDADVTGPSIPKIFGVKNKVYGSKEGLLPNKTTGGISVISSNLLLKNDTDPVLWRGPIIANLVTQFWTEVIWQDIDYLFIDMPPGTGDVALTVFQSISLDGIIIVTSPQELVSMIVEKAVKMANMMDIPILGLVENMSYLECENCNHPMKIFGDSHIEDVAKAYNLDILAKLPLNPALARLCDEGKIEEASFDYLEETAKKLESIPLNYTKIALALKGADVEDDFEKTSDFLLIESCKKMIINQKQISLSKENPEDLITFLSSFNVDVVLANKMKQITLDKLSNNGVNVYLGFEGNAIDASLKHIRGKD